MSIVGTRPPTLDEWNKYELHHRARLAIKPGITGMWQVSGRSEITDFEEVVKLDLALCNGERKRQHLLFADYAGELFDERECLNELGEIFAGASNVVVTLDGEKLCDYKEKKKIILHAKVMLVEMQKAGILSKQTHLYIVCTKYDKIKNSDKKDAIIKFVNDKYQSLKESFAPNVGKMDLCYLYAYGIDEKEEREKMEELLLNFMKEDDFHIQERMEEEPIKVERQMDKFKMRG